MSMFLVTDEKKKDNDANIVAKAEYMVTIEWDNDSLNDIDLWMKAPNGEVIYFRHLSSNLGIFLERDDLGGTNDIIVTVDGDKKIIPINKEVITMRAIVPGNYTINIHAFSLKKDINRTAENVKVSVIKINPFKIVLDKQVLLDKQGQEVTVWSFVMDKEGNIGEVETFPVPMVYKR